MEYRRPTDAELRVLQLVANGFTDESAGAELGLSKETTRTQMNNAMRRLGVHTRAKAVAISLCEGWIDCPD